MSIYSLLKASTFDAQTAEAVAAAFEDVLVDFKLVNRRDALTDLLAERVFRLAECGEHDPSRLREQVAIQLAVR